MKKYWFIIMLKYISIFIIILLFSAVNRVVTAQDITDSLQVYNLKDTIVVVADRYKQPLKNLTNTYQIIPGKIVEDIARHSALEMVDIVFPSAYLLQKMIIGYGVGSEGAGIIHMRGQGGKPNTGMLVLLNGHPDFMGIFGHPLPDVYGLDDVEQIEILAGPSSTVFGSQAMGGVINIKSGPDYSRLLKLSMTAGSYKTYNVGINFAKMFNKSGFFTTIRHKYTDGHIAKSSFKSYHFQTGWQYQINPHWQVSIQGRYVPYEFDDPARTSDPAALGIYGKINRGTGEVILENSTDFIQGSSQIYGNWGEHRFYDGFKSKDFAYGFSSYQNFSFNPNLNFAIGGDLIFYGGQARNDFALPGIVNDETHQFTSVGVYGLTIYNPYSSLSLKFGLRYQYNSKPLKGWAPTAGINVSLSKSLKLYANYQSGFRFPTLNELYLFPISNPNLEQELIQTIESGMWLYWDDLNSLRLTVFRNDVENIIQAPLPPPPIPYANSGQADQIGLETQLTQHVLKDFNLQISYSYLNPDLITAYNPRNQIKIFFNYSNRKFNASFFTRYVDHLYADNNEKSRLKDYTVSNLTLSYALSVWHINLKLLNIFNRKYDVKPGYMAPGFHFMAGFDYRLK
jgi:iron complex outermembrane receptor protein